MIFIRYLFGSLTLLLCATGAWAEGPFGIEMGTPLDKFEMESPGPKAILKSVPKPHPAFETYGVWASKGSGTCLIMGLSKTYDNDRYGAAVQSDFAKFADALAERYGTKASADFLKPGALWKEPNEWVMSIYQNERLFGTEWSNPNEKGNGGDLLDVNMELFASGSDSAQIKLQYRFKNFDKCQAEIEKESNDSF